MESSGAESGGCLEQWLFRCAPISLLGILRGRLTGSGKRSASCGLVLYHRHGATAK